MTACYNDDCAEPMPRLPLPGQGDQHAMWLYHCFGLNLRGVVVPYESIRERDLRFDRLFANILAHVSKLI